MNEFFEILLDGITYREFVVFYSAGIAGISVRFLLNLSNGINHDKDTPYKFCWQLFWKGGGRVFASLIIMIFVVARFPEYSKIFLNIENGGADAHVNITAGLAFLLGLGIDEILKRVVGGGVRLLKEKKMNR